MINEDLLFLIFGIVIGEIYFWATAYLSEDWPDLTFEFKCLTKITLIILGVWTMFVIDMLLNVLVWIILNGDKAIHFVLNVCTCLGILGIIFGFIWLNVALANYAFKRKRRCKR